MPEICNLWLLVTGSRRLDKLLTGKLALDNDLEEKDE